MLLNWIKKMLTRREFFLGFVTICIAVFFVFVMLEVSLRFFPVNEGLKTQPVTFDQPVHKFNPDNDVLWSRDWNFSIVNHVRVNKQGFVNNSDYEQGSDKPVLAVVGDSYVEAAMVPFIESLHGRLERDAKEKAANSYGVYSFGLSGAPLSQYLALAKHAQENYNTKLLVIPVIGNDFDESLPQYHYTDTFFQFVRAEDGALKPELMREFRPIWWKELIRESAVVRYLYFNVGLSGIWWKLKNTFLGDKQDYVGNTTANTSLQRLKDSEEAVDTFLALLPEYSGLPPAQIVFVVDTPRGHHIYGHDTLPSPGDSYFEQMREYFIQKARMAGYEAVDLRPLFFKDHKRTGAKFEFPTDGHWNAEGHRVAYEAVLGTESYKRFLLSRKR